MRKGFLSRQGETRHWPSDIVQAWLTRENLNEVILTAGYSGEIELLSLDIDGVDFWLWEWLSFVHPRVVVLEYNCLLGPNVSLSIPYRLDFVAEFTKYGSDYAGASLQGFISSDRRKGYCFVGANAFFVRNEISPT